jgi:hypothetical protein
MPDSAVDLTVLLVMGSIRSFGWHIRKHFRAANHTGPGARQQGPIPNLLGSHMLQRWKQAMLQLGKGLGQR